MGENSGATDRVLSRLVLGQMVMAWIVLAQVSLAQVSLAQVSPSVPVQDSEFDRLSAQCVWATKEDRAVEAEVACRRLVAFWRVAEDAGELAIALDHRGRALIELGRFAEARTDLAEALDLRIRLGSDEQVAETRNELCLALQRLGEWPDALDCYRQSLLEARLLEDRALEGTVLNNLGGIHSNLAEPVAALEYFRQSLDLKQVVGDLSGQSIALHNLGFLHRGLGELEQALIFYHRAWLGFQELGDVYWQARTLNNMGRAHHLLGHGERAKAYLLQALPLRRQAGDRAGETTTLRNLARVYGDLEAVPRAIAFARKALESSLERGDRRGEATARQLLAQLELKAGSREVAGLELARALELHRQIGDPRQEAQALELAARLHQAEGASEAATESARQALELHRRVSNPLGELSALTLLARLEPEERFSSAIDYLDQALGVAETARQQLGDPSQRALFLSSQREVYELYAQILFDRHLRAPEHGYDQRAFEISERSRSRSLLDLFDALAYERRVAQDPDLDPKLRLRLTNARRQVAAKTERRLEILARDHSSTEARAAEQELFAAVTELEVVRAELRRSHPQPESSPIGVASLFQIQDLLADGTVLLEFMLLERRSLLWRLTSNSLEVHELPSRDVIESAVRRLRRELGKVDLRTGKTSKDAAVDLAEMLFGPVVSELRDQRLAIVADGALHLVPFAALAVPRVEPYRPLLERHEVVYLPSASVLVDRRSHGVVGAVPGTSPPVPGTSPPVPGTSPGNAFGVPGTSPPTHEKLLAILADPIFRADDDRLRSSDAVPAGAVPGTSPKPSGAVPGTSPKPPGAVPGTSPPVPGTSPPVPGTSPPVPGTSLTPVPGTSPTDAYRSGADLALTKLPRLVESRREAETIAARVDVNQRWLALGAAANRATVLGPDLKDYRILHFATHGVIPTEAPELSGLVLSQFDAEGRPIDGFLGLRDVTHLDLKAELVVLSGCQTALGRRIHGEGLMGLSRGFMYAGVPKVLASLWQVQDRATADLMDHFYRFHLESGLPPAAALRAAQLQLHRASSRSDPFYWAAFVLTGDWR